jgi:delta 1-pyrroline-5-carboxylate dehydrogenase
LIIDFFGTFPMRAAAALIAQSIVTEPMRTSAFMFLAAGQGARMQEVEQLIGGAWLPGDHARTLTVFDPVTGEPVTTFPVASEADVTAAVKGARDAAPGWARTPAGSRAAALHAAANAVEDAIDELAAVLSAEMGKPAAG